MQQPMDSPHPTDFPRSGPRRLPGQIVLVLLGGVRLCTLGHAQLIESAGGVQILDAPFSSDTGDHPPEQGPKIGNDVGVVQRFQRVGQGVDLEPVRKRLSATTNKEDRKSVV